MTIREWMARFDAALVVAPVRRRALCEELDAHFADALSAGESEAAVTAAAGPPERVAVDCSRQANLSAMEGAAWRLVAGVIALGLFWMLGIIIYPRGQWTTPPQVLMAPHHLGLAGLAAAGAVGAVALLALRSRRLSRWHASIARAAPLFLLAVLALHMVAGTIYVWLRNGIVAGSPGNGAQAVISAAHLLVAALAAAPLVGAARRLHRARRGAGSPGSRRPGRR